MDVAFFVGATTLVGTGMMFISLFKHFCGIFKIARWDEINIRIKVKIFILNKV